MLFAGIFLLLTRGRNGVPAAFDYDGDGGVVSGRANESRMRVREENYTFTRGVRSELGRHPARLRD